MTWPEELECIKRIRGWASGKSFHIGQLCEPMVSAKFPSWTFKDFLIFFICAPIRTRRQIQYLPYARFLLRHCDLEFRIIGSQEFMDILKKGTFNMGLKCTVIQSEHFRKRALWMKIMRFIGAQAFIKKLSFFDKGVTLYKCHFGSH